MTGRLTYHVWYHVSALGSSIQKRAKRLNKILRKLQKHYLWKWEHGPGLINNDIIDPKDRVHLRKFAEGLFASRIADALFFY